MNVGSLFTGLGGIDLGLERAGMAVRWNSEIDPYCCRVLAKHWPDVPNLGDVTKIDWSTVEPVDLICGGYPCQPFSLAGTRNGDTDPRHLWPHFANAIRHLRPRYALLENVPGHLSLGFGRVLGDLAELGFDAEWDCIPAAALGAPHLRYRLFVVAHAHGDELRDEPVAIFGGGGQAVIADDGEAWDVADAGGQRSQGPGPRDGATVADTESIAVRTGLRPLGPDQQWWGRPGDSGSPYDTWTVEPDVGRVADGVPARVDRLRALGNAVVPQVAEYVGRRIIEAAA